MSASVLSTSASFSVSGTPASWPQVPRRIASRLAGISESELDYRAKLVLAPMVRCGTLPMRMLALQHGAGIVYSPETIDRRLVRSNRVENVVANTIDFIDSDDGTLNLRVHASEKSRLVIQIGSSDPENAVKAALKVANDCAGIDLNCGCPKKFSIVSAMGAALLSEPDRLCGILTALVENVPLPISAKIRMLETTEKTIELAKRIEKTGVSALGLHCRLRSERPQDPGHWEIFEPVATALKIPLIANGDIFSLDDVEKLKKIAPSVSSFMMARAPESNFSIFNRNGPISPTAAIIEYAKAAVKYDMHFHNCKYVLMQMWPASQKRNNTKNKPLSSAPPRLNPNETHQNEEKEVELPPITNLSKSKSFRELCTFIPGLTEVLDVCETERAEKSAALGKLDLARKESAAELGPECPYVPKEDIMYQVKRSSAGLVDIDRNTCGDVTVGEEDSNCAAPVDEQKNERKKQKPSD
ncbi:tRNA-dihydrouridine(20) synthase [NAD(P)+]-like [Physocladia obscura]|uniref:tRNA-dihydrouridine(20) synthase [NAD(P)+]-like n=1 Tax=Physocladia obscura TaxID=109957 RepID=A0AAD5T0T9_9FUNG|nr:tRNA-dihydrouridine(20) synthase [NAD(P)+]-like [Physocladia obscura]